MYTWQRRGTPFRKTNSHKKDDVITWVSLDDRFSIEVKVLRLRSLLEIALTVTVLKAGPKLYIHYIGWFPRSGAFLL